MKEEKPKHTTSPQTKYALTDLVSLEKLQKIQDTFAEASEVASTITDVRGFPITRASNHSKVCTMIRASVKGLANCLLSGEHLGREAAKRMEPFHQKCLSCGFTDAAAPIIVNGEHIANWLIGQYHVRDVDEHRIREYSRQIEVDEEEMVRAFHDMPKLTTERFESILSFLWLMANEISAMGHTNLMLQRQAEELEDARQKLEAHQEILEERVEERTAELEQSNRNLQMEIRRKEEVQREQSMLLTAIENVAEGICITDTTPIIKYANPAFERMTGYTSKELKGKNPKILKSGYHDEQFYREFWQTLSEGNTWSGRLRNRRKDGTVYQEDCTVSPVKDTEGRIIDYIAVKRDVTQELEMERQLQQMSKLESIGTLAAGIAHEINTPVQFVTDNTRFLEEALRDLLDLQQKQKNLMAVVAQEEKFVQEVKAIESFAEEIDLAYLEEEMGKAVDSSLDGLERIASIVKAMKDFSHPGGKEKERANVNELIKNTVEVSRNEWKYHAEVELELDPELPSLLLLSGQFKQVVLNLIVNAAQAIEEKKKIHPEVSGQISIATRHNEECVIVVVKDNGCGIPEKVIDKVFDPFFTTKTVGKGTGQGLSLAYNSIVEGHGGSLQVSSEPDVGTEFTITLPLRSE